ncbi:MAG TPA: hypothetical protein VMM76_18900 [Pirellulaceae bacterium]|nr:hypothetical protein [Pirellulaceae bacterium]
MTAHAPCRTWTEADIAALSPSDIAQLNYDEMLELLNAAQTTVSRPDARQITESEILVRHVYALRQRCRSKFACE